MKHLTFRTVIYLLLDAFLFVVCLLHIPYVVRRPSAPCEVEWSNRNIGVSKLVDSSACDVVSVGDFVTTWHGKRIAFPEMIEYLADESPVGTEVHLGIQKGEQTISASVRPIDYYESIRFVIISLFVGFTVFGAGLFIFLSRPDDMPARAFHWLLVTLGSTMMLTWDLDMAQRDSSSTILVEENLLMRWSSTAQKGNVGIGSCFRCRTLSCAKEKYIRSHST